MNAATLTQAIDSGFALATACLVAVVLERLGLLR